MGVFDSETNLDDCLGDADAGIDQLDGCNGFNTSHDG